MRHRLVATLLGTVLAAGCAGPGEAGIAMAPVARTAADPADAERAAEALDAFGFELLEAGLPEDENVVFSPASIVLALAMARAGARTDTAAQMDAVLHGVAADDHAGWLNALDAALAARSATYRDPSGKESTVTLRIANAPFAQRDYPWKQDYLAALASRFGAGVRLVDYIRDTEAARQAINGWVKDRTEDRIPELLEPGVLDDLTRLALVNAIYLKAAWLEPFSEALTATGSFTRLDGSAVDARYMRKTVSLRYAAGDGWQAVELPYVGGELAMTVIVPDDLRGFQSSLDGARFAEIVGALSDHQVELALPKFGMETKLDLAIVLDQMGMPLAFDPDRADFSGMTEPDRLYISAVIHQANIDVDEKGTTAAAATAVVARLSSGPGNAVTLRVDRPFLYVLRDVPTGAILFLGRVVEPSTRAAAS